MLAAKNMEDVQENFKNLCDKVFSGEPLIVSRPKNENIVMISEKEYDRILKVARNAEYTDKLQRGIYALNAGMGTEHEIIEV